MKTEDTAVFNTGRFERTVKEMAARGEDVHDKGRDVYRRTKKMDPLVDVKGKLRLSHNSFKKDGEKAILINGIALPILSAFDGTASMSENVAKAHAAAGRINSMLESIRGRYNPQMSCAVWQDVDDAHPVVQQTQFEGDDRFAEQIRLLIPSIDGGDATEDYQLGLAYMMLANDTDISNFYGLKGYLFIVGDQIGRERVTVEDVQRHLGFTLQRDMTPKAVAKQLLTKWHTFYLHVGSGGGGSHGRATEWWQDKLGRGRIVVVPDPDLLAEVQAGLIYATETDQPTKEGLYEFLSAGGSNKKATKKVADEVWRWIVEAGVPFGAQTKLAGYADIPMPGAVFTNFRHQWPEGHARYAENVIPSEATVADPSAGSSSPKSEKPDWSRFG